MWSIKAFNDRRSARQGQKAVAQWKENKAQAFHETGAWSGHTDNSWSTPARTKSAEINSGKEVEW